MDLMLNDLLQLTDDEIANSRIELNMTAGAGEERFVDRWLKSEDYIVTHISLSSE